MMHTIENEFLRITVHRKGAELTSLYDKVNGIEHLWHGDPAVWGWHAPVLFPIVGRCLDDKISIDGKDYKMEKHGFARNLDFELVSQEKHSLSYHLSSSESTLSIYPYQFDFYITYTLDGSTVKESFQVVNKETGMIYFSLGGHPAFAVPFLAGERYEDYHIEFEKDTNLDRYLIDTDGFFDGRRVKTLDGSRLLPLTKDMFADDAYIFKNLQSRKVTLRSAKNPHTLSVSFPDFHYLGLWAKVDAPYVCIEPWRGCADTAGHPTPFDRKEEIISLPPLGKFEASIVITIS
jgi:galactose mutarotase-like enzyme